MVEIATGLSSNTSYILAVHATNPRGRSATVYVGGRTSAEPSPLSTLKVGMGGYYKLTGQVKRHNSPARAGSNYHVSVYIYSINRNM